jgi:hypothetical protein
MTSQAEDEWMRDKANGTLDDPTDPNWVVPDCSLCNKEASLAVMPKTYAIGILDNPPYPNAVFYCDDHYPNKHKSHK